MLILCRFLCSSVALAELVDLFKERRTNGSNKKCSDVY